MLGDLPRLMRGSAGRAAFAMALASSLFGCVRHYRPPQPNEPHAVLKVRRSYDSIPGPLLRERLLVAEDVALDVGGGSELAGSAKMDALLVHPGAATFTLLNDFFHRETRQVQETYYEQRPYQSSETYSCGTGTNYRTCSRSVTRYQSVPRTRWTTRVVDISDGSCKRAISFAPRAGAVYLLQYTYQDSGVCALACYEQQPAADGSFSQVPCVAESAP